MRNTRHYWGMPCMAAAIMILAAVSFSSAAERQPGISIGFNAGTGWMLDGELGAGFSGRAFVEYAPYIHEIGLKLSGGYLWFEDTETVGIEPLADSDDVTSDHWYLTGGAVYRLSRSNIVPFLTANLGAYHYYDEQLQAAGGPTIDGVQSSVVSTVKEREGYAFGINGGGGVEFFTSASYSISVESLVHLTFGDECFQIVDLTVMFRFF